MATKPTPGASDGVYGTQMNAFLDVSLAADGKIINEALQTASTAPVADAALANKKYVDDAIVTAAALPIDFGTRSELTIASGEVTVTESYHAIDTESDAASDDLDTINGGTTGDIVVFRSAAGSRETTFKDGTGNLRLSGDFILTSAEDTIMLIRDGSVWLEISRSNNG